jgi:hypothetical protein
MQAMLQLTITMQVMLQEIFSYDETILIIICINPHTTPQCSQRHQQPLIPYFPVLQVLRPLDCKKCIPVVQNNIMDTISGTILMPPCTTPLCTTPRHHNIIHTMVLSSDI